MIQYRNGVFETNSSSTHSITIRDKNIKSPDLRCDGETVTIFLEEFCDGNHWSQNSRAAFLVENIIIKYFHGNALWYSKDRDIIQNILYQTEEYIELKETIIRYMRNNGYPSCDNVIVKGEGYIDHDSAYSGMHDILDTFDVSIEEWIFGADIYLHFEFNG